MLTIIRQNNFSIEELAGYLNAFILNSVQDDDVRQHTLNVVLSNPDINPLISLHRWVRDNVTYRDDPSLLYPGEVGELFISPVRMIKDYNKGIKLYGDCDDSALLLTTLYRCTGYEAHIVLLDTQGAGFDHAITVINVTDTFGNPNGMTVYADATGNVPCGWIETYERKLIV